PPQLLKAKASPSEMLFCVDASMAEFQIGLNQVDLSIPVLFQHELLQNLAEIFCKTLQHLFFFLYLHP
ncbi:MAG: hypothetical protein J7619_32170, partial [Dyadobacter sp.]|uniref:hypothetical protein n=1 Tax=Dyadobacter sp. TaxID=1914288 RepID=UPI001B298637